MDLIFLEIYNVLWGSFNGIEKHAAVPVKNVLKVLIQHNLVEFSAKTPFSQPIYQANSRNIYFLIRLQRAFELIQQQLGLEARGIVEEIVCRGQLPMSKLLFICGWKQYDDDPNKSSLTHADVLKIVKKHSSTFEALAVNHYCCRTAQILYDPEDLVPQTTYNEAVKYTLPPVNVEVIATRIREENSDLSDFEDSLIGWKIDISNFYREWRDDIVTSALKRRYQNMVDNKIVRILASKTFTCSLEKGLPAESPWLTHRDIAQHLARFEDGEKTAAKLDEHLDIMLQDPKTVLSCESPDIGPYSLNYSAAMKHIMFDLVEHIILQRHGFFAARIFRLIRDKIYIEQDRIAEVGMIPSKEAKHLTFVLMHDNFIKMKEVRKTYNATAASNKIAFFFHIDINDVASALLEFSFRSMTNSHIRRNFEKYNFRMSLAKEERVTRIYNTVRGRGATTEQLQEIEDLITPPEKEVLKRARIYNDKLPLLLLPAAP
ncbi:unnamed protein product [Allacma fusca]|uniref:DNA-directed RNA polymerase III subunit RPC3 n=1 Tax=Allacma fusca TaxID=39272 RepID=A0A8J2JU67_9HEXA|nr:unnamed protein product [Allacma fusca]